MKCGAGLLDICDRLRDGMKGRQLSLGIERLSLVNVIRRSLKVRELFCFLPL